MTRWPALSGWMPSLEKVKEGLVLRASWMAVSMGPWMSRTVQASDWAFERSQLEKVSRTES